jgi:hypothetical protein
VDFASYILMHIPARVIRNITPKKYWNGWKSSIPHFRLVVLELIFYMIERKKLELKESQI